MQENNSQIIIYQTGSGETKLDVRFYNDPSIKHKRLLAKDHVDKNDTSLHLQKVNNVHAQLRRFLRPFNGVSSKYLQNYLNWYSYVAQIQNSKTTIKQWFLAMLITDQAYALFELFKQNAVLIRT